MTDDVQLPSPKDSRIRKKETYLWQVDAPNKSILVAADDLPDALAMATGFGIAHPGQAVGASRKGKVIVLLGVSDEL